MGHYLTRLSLTTDIVLVYWRQKKRKNLPVESVSLLDNGVLAALNDTHVIAIRRISLNEILLRLKCNRAALRNGHLPGEVLRLHVGVDLFEFMGGANILTTMLIMTVLEEAAITTDLVHVVPALSHVKLIALIVARQHLVSGLEVIIDSLLVALVDDWLAALTSVSTVITLLILVHEWVLFILVLRLGYSADGSNATINVNDLLRHALGRPQHLRDVVLILNENRTVLLKDLLSTIMDTLDVMVFDVLHLLFEGPRRDVA